MSFSGKKYKRVSSENIDEMIEAAHISGDRAHFLKSEDSAFIFTRVDDQTYAYSLFTNGKTIETTFKLNHEHEMERRDGTKVKVIHYQESENVLSQTIIDSSGRQAHFKRVFDGNTCVLTISSPTSDVQAKICYEVVE